MEITEFVFRLILIFIPGLMVFFIIRQLIVCEEFDLHEIIGYSLVFGFICHLPYFLICKIPWFGWTPTLIQNLSDKNTQLDFREIFVSTIFALPVSFILSFAYNHKWLHRFAHKIHVSRRFGDLDVWGFLMNSEKVDWVTIRDLKNDLIFEGRVMAFEDVAEKTGIALSDVIVYRNSSGERLYSSPRTFIARDKNELIFNFPNPADSKGAEKVEESKDAEGSK